MASQTRRTLGTLADGTAVFPKALHLGGYLRISDRLVTDLAQLRSLNTEALQAPTDEAILLLDHGMTLVQGPPFDGPGYTWAHDTTMLVAEASHLIENTAIRLIDLALQVDDVDVARQTAIRALRSLPGNEPISRMRMRAEQLAGNVAGVHAAYRELVSYGNSIGFDPSPATTDLHDQIVHHRRNGHSAVAPAAVRLSRQGDCPHRGHWSR